MAKKSKAKYTHSAKGLLPPDSYKDLLLLKQRTGRSFSSLIREGVRMIIAHYKENGTI
jgi:hypothetical protein